MAWTSRAAAASTRYADSAPAAASCAISPAFSPTGTKIEKPSPPVLFSLGAQPSPAAARNDEDTRIRDWLDSVDGKFLARAKARSRIGTTPLVVGDLVLVQTDRGRLEAWQAKWH